MDFSKGTRMQEKKQVDRTASVHQLLDLLKANNNFIITTHKSCDPDGIGSELGLDFLLDRLGKKHSILNPDKTPDRYAFLDPMGRIHSYDESRMNSTAQDAFVIMVDNSDIGRILDISKFLNPERSNLIAIDHHD